MEGRINRLAVNGLAELSFNPLVDRSTDPSAGDPASSNSLPIPGIGGTGRMPIVEHWFNDSWATGPNVVRNKMKQKSPTGSFIPPRQVRLAPAS